LGYRIQTGDGRENANRDVLHFFKSFSDGEANINIKAEGQNEHHKIEAILRLSPKRSR
jgi:imidazoleglycerol phosphate dehydratase HisB